MKKYVGSFLFGFIGMSIIMAVTGCSATRIDTDAPTLCVHPAIMGGIPFRAPDNNTVSHGVLRFVDTQGNRFFLLGAVCIKVEAAKNE